MAEKIWEKPIPVHWKQEEKMKPRRKKGWKKEGKNFKNWKKFREKKPKKKRNNLVILKP